MKQDQCPNINSLHQFKFAKNGMILRITPSLDMSLPSK